MGKETEGVGIVCSVGNSGTDEVWGGDWGFAFVL